MKYELPEELKKLGERLEDLYELVYEPLKREVLLVINNNIRDENILSHTFDKLINIPSEKCYKLLLLLCEYVSTFNKKLVDDYLEIYNELYGDDDITYQKK